MARRRPAPRKGIDAMTHRLALDRFEEGADGAALAVLVADDGASIVVPRAFLPAGAEAGMTVALSLTIDRAATAEVARDVEATRADLKKTDPGGTIRL